MTVRTNQRRRGAALVEFAIVFPIFLLALFGIIEFGRAIMVQQIITNAAREGARMAVIPGATTAAVTTAVNNYLDNTSVKNNGNRTITVKDKAGNNLTIESALSKTEIHVAVSVPYNEVSFGLGLFLKGSTLATEVIMRKE